MGFAFPSIDPETSGQVTDLPVPIGRYLDAAYSTGQHDSILGSLNRMGEVHAADIDPTSRTLDPEEANSRYGVGDLKFDRPIKESVAQILNQRKRDEMDRQFFMSKGSSKTRFLPGMAAQILGGVLNPLDIGAMFIPFVGEERAASLVAQSGGGVLKQLLARRLITREAIQETFPRFPGFAEAAINGGLQQTLYEIPNLAASIQDRADYGFEESAINIAGGALISGGIHSALRLLSTLGSGTRMEMSRQALNQFVSDESIDVGKYAKVDDAHINDANVGELMKDPEKKVMKKNQELEQRIKDGKTVDEETVKKYQAPNVSDGSDITKIDEDIKGLKDSLSKDVAPEAQGTIDQMISKLDEHIKNLENDPTKLMMDPFLIQTLGKPIIRGLLIALREGLQLTKDLGRAVDHAMEWLKGQGASVDEERVRKELENVAGTQKDFTYSIQSELNKPQPFNVTPDRFTAQVIMKKIGQLPKPEQIMLKNAGVANWLKQHKGQVPLEEFRKFVDQAMLEPEIRPMLNVEQGKGRPNKGDLLRMQHELETLGFKLDPQGNIVSRPRVVQGDNRLSTDVRMAAEEYEQMLKAADKWAEQDPRDVLEGDYVSQNVSVPIDFKNMEKPRTIFLAADQNVHVRSDHYSDVYPHRRYTYQGHPEKETFYVDSSDPDLVGHVAAYIDDDGKRRFVEGLTKQEAEELVKNKKIKNEHFLKESKEKYARELNKKNMLAWAETHVATLPDGRRVLHVFEVQSDVRQSFEVIHHGEEFSKGMENIQYEAHYLNSSGKEDISSFPIKQEAQTFVDQKLHEYQEKVQPLIEHTDEILLKAVTKLAKREGLDGVVISDPRTAMLTQGHTGGIDYSREDLYGGTQESRKRAQEYQLPSQAPGMTQAYGQKLPSIMQKITGHGPEHVELGGKHYAYEDFLKDAGDFAEEDTPPMNVDDVQQLDEKATALQYFSRAYPGTESPSGNFFDIADVAKDRPYEMFTNKMPEPPRAQIEAITAAVDCLIRKI